MRLMFWTKPAIKKLKSGMVVGVLEELGSDPTDVAAALKKINVKGSSNVHGCPIAVFLNRRFPGYSFSVGKVSAHWYKVEDCRDQGHTVMPLPVIYFVNRFDHSEYPELKLQLR